MQLCIAPRLDSLMRAQGTCMVGMAAPLFLPEKLSTQVSKYGSRCCSADIVLFVIPPRLARICVVDLEVVA